jgi:hypothetical protein
VTPSEKADAIERDRRRKEDELLILLLLLADGLRYEIYRDLRDGLELRHLDTHLDRFAARATREIADSMAQAHRTAYFRLGKFTGGQIGRADADSTGNLSSSYRPQATEAAQAMADSLRTAVLSGVAEQRQAASSVRVGLASEADTALAGLSDKAVIKRAFDTAGYTAAHPQALDAGVERAIVGASNSGMFSAINSMGTLVGQEIGIRHHTVLDGRETDICHDRAGLVLRASHPYWKSGGVPQLHWRCRSTLLPVMPPFQESETLPTVPPMPGFGFGLLPAFAAGTGAAAW